MVIDILKNKGYLKHYRKNTDVFEKLKEHQAEAIQHAKERVDRLTRNQVNVICRDSNPVTTVYELVEFLNGKGVKSIVNTTGKKDTPLLLRNDSNELFENQRKSEHIYGCCHR